MEAIKREYCRQTSYNYFIRKIISILNIRNKRQLYENKNIIERFVLEIINYNLQESVDHFIFLNEKISDIEYMSKSHIFQKMLAEYSEKNIIVSDLQKQKILHLLNKIHIQFLNNEDFTSPGNPPKCKLKIYRTHVILTYQDYSKYLVRARYDMLADHCNTPAAIFKMILRYSMFDHSGQQWSIGDYIYPKMIDDFQLSLEMFASPLNNTLPRYCSLFPDTDRPFGSLGDYFSLTSRYLIDSKTHGALFNPPYLPLLMERATAKLLQMMTECASNDHALYIVSFLPAWYDSQFMQMLDNSPFILLNRQICRGQYYLKQRHDDSVMISNFDITLVVLHSIPSTIDKILVEGRIENIIKQMRTEIKMSSLLSA